MEKNQGLRPDTEKIVAKVIDGETIIMNVRSGIYYSMEGVGTFIWDAIERGCTVDQIIRIVAERYQIAIQRAGRDVIRLAEKLIEEGVVTTGGTEPVDPDPEMTAETSGQGGYETPELQIYRDMGDLLALDPPAPSALDLHWKE